MFFTFNGMFVFYLETFFPWKLNDGIQNFENWRRFALSFCYRFKKTVT